jgi:hypothetical protein
LTWVVAALGPCLLACDRVFEVLEVDDPGSSDAGSAGSCLSDDFSAADVDDTKWVLLDAPPVATAAQAAGELVLTLGQADGANYAILVSASRDFTHDAASIEVIAPPDPPASAEAGLSLQSDQTHRYMAFVAGPDLVLRTSTPAGNDDDALRYSATNHKFLRIRHTDNAMLWETSPDRDNWTTRRTMTPAVDVTALELRIFAGTYQFEQTPPGAARFDNVAIECLP